MPYILVKHIYFLSSSTTPSLFGIRITNKFVNIYRRKWEYKDEKSKPLLLVKAFYIRLNDLCNTLCEKNVNSNFELHFFCLNIEYGPHYVSFVFKHFSSLVWEYGFIQTLRSSSYSLHPYSI